MSTGATSRRSNAFGESSITFTDGVSGRKAWATPGRTVTTSPGSMTSVRLRPVAVSRSAMRARPSSMQSVSTFARWQCWPRSPAALR